VESIPPSLSDSITARNRLSVLFANRQTDFHTLKTSLLSAIRAMAPTLLALSLTSVAHAQGTMDFSGATTLMSTFVRSPSMRVRSSASVD